MLKTLTTSAAAALLMAGSASAEDGARYEGVYVGAGLGYSQTYSDFEPSGITAGADAGGSSNSGGGRLEAGVLGMKHLGGPTYLGLEMNAFYDNGATSGDCGGTTGLSLTCSSEEALGGSIQARLGFEVANAALLYAKGGVVAASYEDKIELNGLPIPIQQSEDGWNVGWTVGGGAMFELGDSGMFLDLSVAYEDYGSREMHLLGVTEFATVDRRTWTGVAGLKFGF